MAALQIDSENNRSPQFLFSIYSMDEELYYHRIFLRPYREIVLPRYDDPKVQFGPLTIFIQEAIDFSLSTRFEINEWPVPFDMVQMRNDFSDKIYFNSMIGRAICHACAAQEAFAFARVGGFNLEEWLKQSPLRAMETLAKFLEIVRKRSRPVNISIIYMLAFVSNLVFEAINSNKPELIDATCRSTIYMFLRVFPYEWIYWNTRLWSVTYNALHHDIHKSWSPGRINHNLA